MCSRVWREAREATKSRKTSQLIDVLENGDVQKVYANFDIPNEVIGQRTVRLSGTRGLERLLRRAGQSIGRAVAFPA